MSKTNVYVLIATVLLGVLLFVVRQFAMEVPVQEIENFVRETMPNEPTPDTPIAATEEAPASDVPQIASYEGLVRVLDDLGLDGELFTADAARWYQSRGFLGPLPLFGIDSAAAPVIYFESLDDDTLASLGEGGDIGALQALAGRRVFDDAGEAIKLYQQAAALGSSFALLQVAGLYETMAQLSDLANPPRASSSLPSATESQELLINAAAQGMAAIRTSGIAIANNANNDVLGWLEAMYGKLDTDSSIDACGRSENVMIQYAQQRRQRGIAPVATDAPAVFLTVADVDARLPCNDTPYPADPILDISSCANLDVTDEHGESAILYLCQSN